METTAIPQMPPTSRVRPAPFDPEYLEKQKRERIRFEGEVQALRDILRLVSPSVLAEALGIKVGTLALWRQRGAGPKYVKIGRAVMYRVMDVSNWFDRTVAEAAGHGIELEAVSEEVVPDDSTLGVAPRAPAGDTYGAQ